MFCWDLLATLCCIGACAALFADPPPETPAHPVNVPVKEGPPPTASVPKEAMPAPTAPAAPAAANGEKPQPQEEGVAH